MICGVDVSSGIFHNENRLLVWIEAGHALCLSFPILQSWWCWICLPRIYLKICASVQQFFFLSEFTIYCLFSMRSKCISISKQQAKWDQNDASHQNVCKFCPTVGLLGLPKFSCRFRVCGVAIVSTTWLACVTSRCYAVVLKFVTWLSLD